jgi:hypothetical protein
MVTLQRLPINDQRNFLRPLQFSMQGKQAELFDLQVFDG